ncbi:protein phosphatase 1 regulatory subunit 26 [Odontesthes bonariensis]|uniref:protein phosphatase 1 regulatory subunit 26 n=1 Tax=Odontesthes bonariensis TaxID=219752 RepID=UPI003F58E859
MSWEAAALQCAGKPPYFTRMYLMNVPPVAATQTEWRRCGPPGGFSLPVCFNDSDTELSTRGTPISDKVQMIIESLRSTQSSLEMGDEIEGNVLSGQEGHTQVCKAAVGSYVAAKCKTKSPTDNPRAHVSSTNNHDSSDSDSDDSVDRGIEEAILEYLKEKDDHKRKAEPCAPFFQSSKIPRKNPSVLELSEQNSGSHTSFDSSGQFPRHVKAETPTAPATIPIKKYIKNKASLDENFDLNKSSTKTLISSKETTQSPSKTTSLSNKTTKCPVTVKVEEVSNDSSSDDGIEEAIQRYQLEKQEQQNKREVFNPHAFQVESESTSDDGIEEAIRSYQLEQLKEKNVFKPFLQKQKPFSKALMHAVGSTSLENMKKHKLKKKKGRTDKQIKSLQPHPSSVLIPKTTRSDSPKGKGNGLVSLKVETFQVQPAPAPPKVNTTAELMCAEAILDISKTVMPGPFHHSVGIDACAPTNSSLHSSVPENCPFKDSNDSSVDSEDGIEQEIRKFLEQKAQMHKQPPGNINEPEKVKEVAIQKKPQRLSLTQRRKHKEKNVTSGADDKGKETTHMPLIEPTKESNPVAFSQRNQTYNITALHKTDQSGDKSSSLDSDEDLDTAIKDLLKTKKKSKKKIRDLKRKSRKGIKDEEPLLGSAVLTKKFKPEPTSKSSALKKVHKSKDNIKEQSGLSKNSISQQRQIVKSKEHNIHEGETGTVMGVEGGDHQSLHTVEALLQMKDDSSSVDSDDSIEQEIRRFLAEKAKVSTADKTKDGDVSRNGTVMVQDANIKQEPQLAEIPRKSISPFTGSLSSPVQDGTPQRPPDICPVSAQSCVSSVQSCSPNLLEPADGAGAARTEQWRPNVGRDNVNDGPHQMARDRPVLSANVAHSRAESIKWRQSLGLPISDTRTLSRTPFHITSSEIKETAPATLPHHKSLKSQSPATAWFSSRTSRAPFLCSTEAAVNITVRPPVLNFFSSARQHSKMSFTQSLTPGHRPQFSMEEERASMVQMPKDKSVFVELESNMTNHVQVQSRERREGKERVDLLSERKREGESMTIDDKDVHQDKEEEEFIDESDCESGSRRDPGKKQGFSTL